MKKFMLLMIVVALLLPSTLLAQGDDWNTFISEDELVTFQYPADWIELENEDGDVYVTNNPDLSPDLIGDLGSEYPEDTLSLQVISSEQEDEEGFSLPITEDMSPQFTLGMVYGLYTFVASFSGATLELASLGDFEVEGFDSASFLTAQLGDTELYVAALVTGDIGAAVLVSGKGVEDQVETLEEILSTLELSPAEE